MATIKSIMSPLAELNACCIVAKEQASPFASVRPEAKRNHCVATHARTSSLLASFAASSAGAVEGAAQTGVVGAEDFAGDIERLAVVFFAVLPDGVEVLEREPDRIHEFVTTGAARAR